MITGVRTGWQAWSGARGPSSQIAKEFGLMLDVHSGDDLTAPRDGCFSGQRGGSLHFKVSPRLQLIYAELFQELSSRSVRPLVA